MPGDDYVTSVARCRTVSPNVATKRLARTTNAIRRPSNPLVLGGGDLRLGAPSAVHHVGSVRPGRRQRGRSVALRSGSGVCI